MFLLYVLTIQEEYEEIEHCSALSGTDCVSDGADKVLGIVCCTPGDVFELGV